MTIENHPTEAVDAGAPPVPPQAPTAEEARISAIDAELAQLDAGVAKLTSSREFRLYREKRDALSQEKSQIQIAPVLKTFDGGQQQQQEKGEEKPQEQETREPELGKPTYELEVPALLTATQQPVAADIVEDMSAIGTVMGIGQEEMQTLADFVIGQATETLEGLNTANREEVIAHIHSQYGASADVILKGAQEGFKKLPESVQRWLDAPDDMGQRLGNHPAVLSLLSLWGGGYSKLTPAAAAKELAQLRASKLYASGDRLTLDKVRLLGLISTRGSSNELPAPRQVVPSSKTQGRAKLEAEARQIRLDPGYTDKSRANNKQLVARMAEIMSALHGTE